MRDTLRRQLRMTARARVWGAFAVGLFYMSQMAGHPWWLALIEGVAGFFVAYAWFVPHRRKTETDATFIARLAQECGIAATVNDMDPWESGYEHGLAIGRDLARPMHRTYIVDKVMYQRIAEHAFLNDTTVKDLLDPARVSRRAGARGESDG